MKTFKLTLGFNPFEENPFENCSVSKIYIHPAISRGYVTIGSKETLDSVVEKSSKLSKLRNGIILIYYNECIGDIEIGENYIVEFKKKVLNQFNALSKKEIVLDYLTCIRDSKRYDTFDNLSRINDIDELMKFFKISDEDVETFRNQVNCGACS